MFLNPPSFRGYDGGAGSRYQARREIRSFWYPTWLAQAAALVDNGKLVDAPADDLSIADVLRLAEDYDCFIIYTSTPSFTNDADTAVLIKKRCPNAVVGLVGPHVSVLADQSLQAAPAVDFVVRGEFELAVRQIASGTPIGDVPGASWRDGDTLRHNPDSDLITNLDSLPFVVDVYKRDLTIENYYIGYLLHPYLSLYTGRGCPGRCTFCLWPQTMSGHNYRVRTPDSVYEELALAKESFPQVKEFFIDDDTFTAKPERAVGIARLVSKLGIPWSSSSRVSTSYDTLRTLKEHGLRLLMVGFESGSDEILRNIRKGTTTDMARCFMRNCKSLGIAVHGTFMLGLPGETRETIEQTMRFASELAPETLQVSVATPYPGTELYSQAVRNGWLKDTELVSADGTQNCALSYPHLGGQEILDSVDSFYKRYYFRPRVIFAITKQMMRDPQVRKRRLREGSEFLSFLKRRESQPSLALPSISEVADTGGPGFCRFSVTNACNSACSACGSSEQGPRGKDVVFANVADCRLALNVLAANGVGYVQFAGGEPTLHPHLPGMISHARSLGMDTMLTTNGWLLQDDRIWEYADAGLNGILIYVDAANAQTHDFHRGLPGLSERITQANQVLSKAGVASAASVSISRLLGDLVRLPDFLRSLGFENAVFSYHPRELDCGCLPCSELEITNYSDSELSRIYEEIIGLKRHMHVLNPAASLRDMRRFVQGKRQRYPCLGGFKYFYLDCNFNLFRCHAWHRPMCSVWELDDSKIVRDGCQRCGIDCYRDASVMHHVGIAVYDARHDLRTGHPISAASRLISLRALNSVQALAENRDWIRRLQRQ